MRFVVAVMAILAFSAGAASGADAKADSAERLEAVEKLVRAKMYDEALLIVEDILANDAQYAPAIFEKAEILEEQEKTEEAINAYYDCIEVLVDQAETEETRGLLEKCRKVLLKLDKSRRIVLKHADEIEREAQRFKGKNDYAYEKLLETAELMRGVWERRKAAPKASEKELRTRREKFYEELSAEDLDDALEYVDPETRRGAGEVIVKGYLGILAKLLKDMNINGRDLRVRRLEMHENGEMAKIVGEFRAAGQWHEADDPEYWIVREGTWYLGDEKKLRRNFGDK